MELTEQQSAILRYSSDMKAPMIVKGAAGSGKSFITSQIAQVFSKHESLIEKNVIGVVSFTNTLTTDLKRKAGPDTNLKINTAHETLNLFLEANGLKRIISFDSKHLVLNGLDNLGVFKRYDKEFLREEFAWLNANRILSVEQYENVPRKGRGKGGSLDRSYVWKVYSEYKKRLRAQGLYTYSELANVCLEYMETHPDYKRIFTHLIIDEFQDLGKNVIEALVKMCKYQDHIVFVGDLAQSIYKNAFSWKDFDINSKKIFELTDNFRNTKQIAIAAESLLNNEYKLKLYDRQDYTEMVSVGQNGIKPIIAICRNVDEQKWYILNELARIDKKESVAIIRRSRDFYNHNGLNGVGQSWIQMFTMHACKGLEFDNVFIVDANEEFLPNPHALKNDFDVNLANERRLLYVAMTRARKRLFITTSGKPSRFLAEIQPTTISPVAIDYAAYEELYNHRFEELLTQREQIIKELAAKIETLQDSNRDKDDTISRLMRSREFVDESIKSISASDLNFRRDAKILILGGDGGIREKDITFTLKKQFGLDSESYQWIRYDEMKNFNYQTLQGTSSYCDVIVGCIPHKSGGVDNLIAEFENHREYYTPKIHILRDPNTEQPVQLTKTNLIEAVKESNKVKLANLNK